MVRYVSRKGSQSNQRIRKQFSNGLCRDRGAIRGTAHAKFLLHEIDAGRRFYRRSNLKPGPCASLHANVTQIVTRKALNDIVASCLSHLNALITLATPAGFEPATTRLEGAQLHPTAGGFPNIAQHFTTRIDAVVWKHLRTFGTLPTH
jgi:hypothetical protein